MNNTQKLDDIRRRLPIIETRLNVLQQVNDDAILRLLMQRIYTRAEPVAVMTLPWTASWADRALHLLDRVRDALGIEEDDEFSQT